MTWRWYDRIWETDLPVYQNE